MAEWFKAHAWKACVGNTTVSSNLTLSATLFFVLRGQFFGKINMKTIVTLIVLCLFSFHLGAQVSFTISSTLGVGPSPRCLVPADVNGDGKPDLITANISAPTVSVVTNAGGGVMVASGTYTVGSNPNGIAAGDLNGDGKVDLVTSDFGSGGGTTVTILTNGLNGSFANLAT